ncbi:MAG: EamA family transporter [Micromonosporaceae bacterium]
MRAVHVLVAVVVAAIWGFNFVVIDVGVDAFPPLLFAVLRFAVAAVPAVFFVGRPCVPWRWIVVIGMTIGVGQFALLFTGMRLGMPAGLASLVLQTQVFFTLFIAAGALGERVRVRQLAGLGLAFAGIVLVGVDLARAGDVAGLGSGALVGFGMCVGAAGMWGLGNVAIRRAQPDDPFNLMVWTSAVAPLPLLGLSLLVEGPQADLAALANLSWLGAGAVLYIAVLSTLVGFGLWSWLLRRYDAGVVAAYSLLVPVFGMSSAAIVLGEPLTPWRMVAAVAVVAGVALSSVKGRRDSPRGNPAAVELISRFDRSPEVDSRRTRAA